MLNFLSALNNSFFVTKENKSPSSKQIHEAGILRVERQTFNKNSNDKSVEFVNYVVTLPSDITTRVMTYFNMVVVPRGVIMTVLSHNKFATSFELQVQLHHPNANINCRLIDAILRSNVSIFEGISCRQLAGMDECQEITTMSGLSQQLKPVCESASQTVNLYQYRFNGRDVSVNYQRHEIKHDAALEVLQTILQFSVVTNGLIQLVNKTEQGIDIYLLD